MEVEVGLKVCAGSKVYLYNGKELNTDFGLDMLDYGARWYDASTARFHTIDPKAEQFGFQSPYTYAANNPILYIDKNGENPVKLAKMLVKVGYKTYKKLKKAGDFNRKNFTKAIKESGLDEVVDLVGDLYTIVDPASTWVDRGKATFDLVTGFETNNKGNKAVQEAFEDLGKGKTSRAARREAMRDAGIPTSQPLMTDKATKSKDKVYLTRDKKYTVQDAKNDTGHKGKPHWEAGKTKTDDSMPDGLNRGGSKLNKPQVKEPKGKAFYGA